MHFKTNFNLVTQRRSVICGVALSQHIEQNCCRPFDTGRFHTCFANIRLRTRRLVNELKVIEFRPVVK